ncbi:OLC1v1037986C1 [Oldenlandia corymbosa var. corymbosa]|uniref:OLC1v1037986C1 n=1 Tax=Oldenlandia corymbosa var. corymbosa TaxID=529605 RepID=A0AAV1CZW2_OLDCO|nr:OLC1v1037986C1 [Oldenlandia corymbosa var. corymbosa]
MSSCIDVAVAEQLCYIPCNFCNIVLAVSVPCSSLYDIVTVRCGHCTNLWSVNMAAAFHSLSSSCLDASALHQTLQAPNSTNAATPEYRIDFGSSSSKAHHHHHHVNTTNKMPTRPSALGIRTDDRNVNRPPEKRQRIPSAYNQFIKEEIQRIKASNPDISHREAFSTAAKNVSIYASKFLHYVWDNY